MSIKGLKMGEIWIVALPAFLLIGLVWAYFAKSLEADELRRERESRECRRRQEAKDKMTSE